MADNGPILVTGTRSLQWPQEASFVIRRRRRERTYEMNPKE
jgi:hypothetical protein